MNTEGNVGQSQTEATPQATESTPVQSLFDSNNSLEVIDDGGIKVIKDFSSSDPSQIREVQEQLGIDPATPKQEGTYTYNPMWDIMKGQFEEVNAEFNMPEALRTGMIDENTPLTPEQEFNLLRDFIIDNTDFGFDSDPELSLFMSMRNENPNLTFSEYAETRQQQMAIQNMPSDKFLFSMLKNTVGKEVNPQEGFSDEEIMERLAKLSPDEITAIANEEKGKMFEDFNRVQQENYARQRAEIEQRMQREREVEAMQLNTVINTVTQNKGFDGIVFNDESLNQYNNTFKSVFERSEDNPYVAVEIPQKLLGMLSPENLYKVVAYLSSGGNIVNHRETERIRALEGQLSRQPLERGQIQGGRSLPEPL